MISIPTSFPFLSRNIPSFPAYGVFLSQFIRYVRACSSYECFIARARRLSIKLVKRGYLVERMKSSFRKFYGRYGDLIQQYEVSLFRMSRECWTTFWISTNSDFPTNQTFHQFNDLYTEFDLHRMKSGFHGAFATGVACQQGTLTLPDTWFRPPFFGTCFCSYCWDQIPRTCHVFTRLFTLNIPLYFFDFAFYWDVYTILTSTEIELDWINNIDHMHISGTAPSSVILCQTK